MPQPVLAVDAYLGGCETVLLAEDETAVRQSTREFLSLKGYIVLEAKNGTDALAIAREYTGPIHLMVTDVVMPQMGGARLAGELAVERPDMKVMFAPVMPKPRYSATARSMRPQAFCRNPSR